MQQTSRRQKIKLVAVTAISLIAIVLAARFFNDPQTIDWFATIGYNPSPEIVSIEDKLDLTSRAKLILHASDPELENNDSFNEHCNSHNREISVLGCYDTSRIHLYNIQSEELPGIVESTTAHELLHAAWSRLSESEISKLTPLLESAYKEHEELLSEDLKIYDESEYLEELHSRIGTEIKNLPAELETYYARYFNNQDAIVVYYDSYINPFRELSAEIEALSAEMETLSAQIEEKENAYQKFTDELSTKIANFNDCANTAGCFSTDTEFYRQRNALVAEQNNADAMYEDLNGLIDQYNTKVEAYNDNILRNKSLENIMNSNAERNEINK